MLSARAESVPDKPDADSAESQSWCSVRTILTFVFFGIIATIGFLVFFVYGHQQVIKHFLGLVPADPDWRTALAIGGVNYLCCTLCLAFWALGQMVMAFVFGFWYGALYNFITLLLATMSSFVIGRYLFRDYIRREIMKYPHASKAAKLIEGEELKFLIVFRCLPLPLFIKNYLPPTLKVSGFAVFVATAVGGCIYCPIFSAIGAGSQSLASLYVKADPQPGQRQGFAWDTSEIVLVVVAVLAMLSMLALAAHEWRKASSELEPLDPDGMPRDLPEEGLARPAQ